MPHKIIYLHGFASGPSSKKAAFFAQRAAACGIPFEVPDLTAGDFEHLTITGQLEVIRRTAGPDPVSLIGSSLGGYLAALYAARRAEARRVVLLAPAFGFASHWPHRLGAGKMAEWKRNGWLSVFHYGDQRMRPLGYQLIEDGLRYEDFPEVRQPVLLIQGTRDEVVTPDYARQFASGRPNVELELVDSDHELTNVLDWMWTRVSAFLGLQEGHPIR